MDLTFPPDSLQSFLLQTTKVTKYAKKKRIDIIMVDTDGNHEAITPLFLEGVSTVLYPLEVAA